MKCFALLFALFSLTAFGATIVPFEREIARVEKYTFFTSNSDVSEFFRTRLGGDKDGNLYSRGFSVLNIGPNEIITTEPEAYDYANREYMFITDDHARRDTYLWVTDYIGSGRTSDYFETVLYFLPRQSQMHAEEMENDILVTLTTGEEITIFKKYKTITSGVLSEKPMDTNPDRGQRKYADVTYTGKGIVLRSNAKGADPRLAPKVDVLKAGLAPCTVDGETFWTQDGHPKFKFVTDEEAYTVIKEKCGSEYLPTI